MREQYTKLKANFLKSFPDFDNFTNPSDNYLQEERNYKEELHSLFQSEIIPRFKSLPIDDIELEQLGIDIASFFTRKLKSENNKPQNLVGWRYHIFTQDWEKSGKIIFAKAILKLLDKSGDFKKGFKSFMDALEFLSNNCQQFDLTPAASRSLITFFLFISDPDEHFFIKTNTVNKLLSQFHQDKMKKGNLTVEDYRRVQTLAKTIASFLTDDGFKPKDMIDIQSFIWSALSYDSSLNEELKQDNEENEILKETTMSEYPVNQILYGPPGTGKTYHTINKAISIFNPSFDLSQDRKIVKDEFDRLIQSGQIEFVTFHQSYGYEEFIEGIKAIPKGQKGNETGNEMIYKVIPGVFKNLSNKAEINFNKSKKSLELLNKENSLLQKIDLFLSNSLEENGVSFSKTKCIKSTQEKVIHLLNNILDTQGHLHLDINKGMYNTPYDLELLNTDIDIKALLKGLKKTQQGRFCLWGQPGVGKTAFAQHIAQVLDKEVIIKKASDLLDPYVGMTEKKISEAFKQAKKTGAVLQIDEADTFLTDRRQAVRSWEVSQVNELLTQIENFDGIFIASTNLMENFDRASIRRFDLKIHFDYLTNEQVWLMYQKILTSNDILLIEAEEVDIWQVVKSLKQVTPGDFSTILRKIKITGELLTAENLLAYLKSELDFKNNYDDNNSNQLHLVS